MSQLTAIRKHLRSGKKLTGLQALIKFGSMHLPRRIKDLREAGMSIDSKWVKTRTGKRIKQYFEV